MAASGALVAQEFERALARMPGNVRLSSGLWTRYLRGDVLPQGSSEKGGPSLVTRIDRAFPGTAGTFYHPVWELLDFPRLLGPDDLRKLYLSMGEEVWRGMVDLESGTDSILSTEFFHFWRCRRLSDEQAVKIRSMQTLDGLAAGLIEARMAYLRQDRIDFFNAMTVAYGHVVQAKKASILFESKRMQSVLLIMMGLWLQEMGRLVLDPPAVFEAQRQMRTWMQQASRGWIEVCDKHQHELPKHMEIQFRRWRKLVNSY